MSRLPLVPIFLILASRLRLDMIFASTLMHTDFCGNPVPLELPLSKAPPHKMLVLGRLRVEVLHEALKFLLE